MLCCEAPTRLSCLHSLPPHSCRSSYHAPPSRRVASALAELQREEDAYNNKCAALLATSENESFGQVKRMTAVNELEQLKQTDPMPLQRAKINQEAVLRRQQKASKSAAAARVAATTSRTAAEAARVQAVAAREEAETTRQRSATRREAAVSTRAAAEATRKHAEESRAAAEARRMEAAAARVAATATREAAVAAREAAEAARAAAVVAREAAEAARAEAVVGRQAADDAVVAAVEAYQEAVAFLEKTKLEVSAAGKGKIWWMDRELTERKKYMSQKQLTMLAAKGQ